MTIETLAEMINEGFKTTASKDDITRVEVRLDGIESRLGLNPTRILLAKSYGSFPTRLRRQRGKS
jgi:hypothetical protein